MTRKIANNYECVREDHLKQGFSEVLEMKQNACKTRKCVDVYNIYNTASVFFTESSL